MKSMDRGAERGIQTGREYFYLFEVIDTNIHL